MIFDVIWSRDSYKSIKNIIKEHKPDIAHIHNTFFLISPSVYYACKEEGVPIVQTLHNYRFICPLGTLFKNGKLCHDCSEKGLLTSIKNKCGKKSVVWMALMLLILKFHQSKNTFKRLINSYIALSNFAKQQFIKAGFDEQKIKVKPNFINLDPGFSQKNEDFAVYVGRISPEKGTEVLLKAWEKVNFMPLKLIGNGEHIGTSRNYAEKNSLNMEFLGQKSNKEVISYIQKSSFVILPSLCNENFPLTIAEAFACGKPIIASKSGSLAEIIEENKTGLLFEPGDSDDLTKKVRFLFENKNKIEEFGKNARREYELKYTAEINYEKLIGIYQETMRNYKSYSK